jgi:hypothetical protein
MELFTQVYIKIRLQQKNFMFKKFEIWEQPK